MGVFPMEKLLERRKIRLEYLLSLHPRAWKLTPRSARGVFAVPINHKGNRSDPSAFVVNSGGRCQMGVFPMEKLLERRKIRLEYLLSLQQMQNRPVSSILYISDGSY
jgi:hypothetical protein